MIEIRGRAAHPSDSIRGGVLFDLDGVITDTAELHFQSWLRLAGELGLPFDRQANEALRGLSRSESLILVLGARGGEFGPNQRQALLDRKNAEYLRRVAALTPVDVFPGVDRLLGELRNAGLRTAVASSSRNTRAVLDRLELASRFDAVVDGNDVSASKPAPDVFLEGARRLGLPSSCCVVIEDAASGVEAGLAAAMRVIGVGPPERVGRAHRRVAQTAHIRLKDILDEIRKAGGNPAAARGCR